MSNSFFSTRWPDFRQKFTSKAKNSFKIRVTKLTTTVGTTRLGRLCRKKNIGSNLTCHQNNNFACTLHVYVHLLAVHCTQTINATFSVERKFQINGHLLNGWRFFGPQQLQGFKSSAETLCLNFDQVLHPWVSCQQNPNFYDSWASKTKKTKLN